MEMPEASVAEESQIWSCGVLRSSGELIINLILRRSVVRLVRLCALLKMSPAFVIAGCFAVIRKLVDRDSVRLAEYLCSCLMGFVKWVL